jgi:hypothetical protein
MACVSHVSEQKGRRAKKTQQRRHYHTLRRALHRAATARRRFQALESGQLNAPAGWIGAKERRHTALRSDCIAQSTEAWKMRLVLCCGSKP